MIPICAALIGAGLVWAGSAEANYDDGITTVGTDFTREPHEYLCYFSDCYFDAHFPLIYTCGKTASSRLRFQRDLLSDETVREYDNFTGCANWYWNDFHSLANHGHHMDGKVTYRVGQEHVFYTDTHN